MRTRVRGDTRETSTPSKCTLPDAAGCTPESVRSSVDLPAPLAPTSATSSPSFTRRLTESSAVMRP